MVNKKIADTQKEICSPGEHHNTDQAKTPEADFPIIGIGASAGGLEALELFLGNVPEKSGVAFVVVQHLDPTREGIMVELLKRATVMPVFQAQEHTAVQPDCVYLIPPNKDMSLFHGVLHLFDMAAPRGLRLPIDFFFRSLADDRQERSIAVILSGMGTDGTIGLKAIKERSGVVFAQDPTSAKFNGMPKSAIGTGLVDVVAPVEELPFKIIAYLKHKPLMIDRSEPALADKDDSAFEKIIILLRSQTGHDFSLYKKTTVCRRIERRMGIHQIDKLATYIRLLQENPQELQLLFKELLISVTSFFRDPEVWEQLKEQVFPELFSGRAPHQPLRAWVPGCSTGEEAYSLAIVFKEALEHLEPTTNFPFQIFATDLNRDAIEKARQGFYTANIAADVSPKRLRRFFIQDEHGYRVAQEIREMVVFAPHNIIMDPPFTKMDILSCRNLLIYLTPKLQKKLLALFQYSLNPGGILFLGSAETTGSFSDHFVPLEGKGRLYRRLESSLRSEFFEFPSSLYPVFPGALETAVTHPQAQKHIPNLEELADQLILLHYAPAAVLVNDRGDILYTRGRTGKYLEPAAGKANWNIFAMVHAGLRYKLSSAFQKALRQNSLVTMKYLEIDTDSGKHTVDVTLQPLPETKGQQCLVMIVFTEVRMPSLTEVPGGAKRAPAHRNRVAELELELAQACQELQTFHQEMQTSQEELLSAYEELQSTNEELQSTNEETTSSREELQSLNEELQTVNYELQTKVEELSRVNNDMKNLLDSTDIATLFLDNKLCVRRFTAQTAKIIKLIPVDVGRPITDITSDLSYPELAADGRKVMRTLVFTEKSVTAGGRWFRVRIMPYRTLEDKIDGLVITFTDITALKTLEAALKQTQVDLEKRMAKKDMELNEAGKRLQDEIKRDCKEEDTDKTPKSEKHGSDHHEQEQ